MKEIILKSVGCVVLKESLLCYPLDTQGIPIMDEMLKSYLPEHDDEWFNGLDDIDFSTVSELLITNT
jgi:hypothetical protein